MYYNTFRNKYHAENISDVNFTLLDKLSSQLTLREHHRAEQSDPDELESNDDLEPTDPKPHRDVVTRLQYQSEHFGKDEPDKNSDSEEFDEYTAVTGAYVEGDDLIFTVRRRDGSTRQVAREELQKFHLRIYLEFVELLVSSE